MQARLARVQAKPPASELDRRLRWDDVQLFLALFREGTLARAGARTGLDASTLSRRLAALETLLGVRLFDRTREGLAATAYAERLLPEAEAMESCAQRFASGAESFERRVEGKVRISVPPGLADHFVVPMLPRLRALHPALCVELDLRIGVVDLGRREADLALRSVRRDGADLVQKRIVHTRSTVACAAAYAKSLGRLRSWSGVRFVAWGDDLAQLPQARWLREQAVGAEIALVVSSFTTQLAAAEAGVGCVVVPRPYLQVAKLVEPAMTKPLAATLDVLPDDDLWLVAHRALRHVPRVDAVWRFFEAAFAETARTARAG
ncbi:MAG: LysR family transcriptional regulator [Sandaracinaceae bacterium]